MNSELREFAEQLMDMHAEKVAHLRDLQNLVKAGTKLKVGEEDENPIELSGREAAIYKLGIESVLILLEKLPFTVSKVGTEQDTDSTDRLEQAFELGLRVENIIDFGNAQATERFQGYIDSQFDDFVGGAFWDSTRVHPTVEPMYAVFRENQDDYELAADILVAKGFAGVVVNFATPVREYTSEDCCRSGFGHCYTQWVYADTYEAAWELGVAWVAERNAADLERFKREQQPS